ncbi:hypothetical protein ACQP2P_17550 [Dactylosporangium sp. CA-139114]
MNARFTPGSTMTTSSSGYSPAGKCGEGADERERRPGQHIGPPAARWP